MTRTDCRRVLSTMVVLAALAPAVAGAETAVADQAPAEQATALPEPEQTFVSSKDIVVYPPGRGSPAFRFLPDSRYIPYERSIVLSAAPGETRAYLMQVTSGKVSGDSPATTGYLIDKKRPPAPRAEPGTGLFRDAIKPALTGEDGADIFWTLIGPGIAPAAFVKYGEDSRPGLAAPASGTVTYTILAYAVDQSGNRSYPSRFVYRMAEAGLPAVAPIPDSFAITADPALPKPEVENAIGYSELRMAVPSGASLLLALDPDSPPEFLDDFERIVAEGGTAKLRLPCPYGWTNDVSVYYGLLRDGVASFNPQPMVIHLSNPAEEIPLPADPEAPILAADPAGRGAFAVFPSYDGALYVSVDGSEPKLYDSPLALPSNKASVRLSWYGQDDSGQRSVQRTLSLPLPVALPDVLLAGVTEGAAIGGDVVLKPAAKASLRYEIRLDGSNPPEPGPSSPLVGDSLTIACAAGEEHSVVLRYRVFSGESGGEGRILRFSVDRKPPEAPRLTEMPSTYTDRPASVSMVLGSGARDAFASISANGASSPFIPVTGPLEFPGSESGPVSYVLRAYNVDAAGNRSPEMKSLSFVVDRTSVYVAEDGSDKGDGSPDRPYRSFDTALSIAIRTGKKVVNMRGSLEMRVPVLCSTQMILAGGFGKLWAKDSSARTIVRVAIPQGQSAFSQRGGSLSLLRLDLKAESAGLGPLISVSDASLSLEDSSITAGAEGDLILVSALRATIGMDSSRIKVTRAMACTVFSAEASVISVVGSSLTASRGTRIFGAFDMDGGSLTLSESLVDCQADLGINLVSLRASSLLVDRSLIKAEGGSGFLRIGSFKSVKGEIKNSKVLLSWKGPGILFEIVDGGPAFRHDTIIADSDKGGLRFFDARGELPQIWNSILECSGKGSELLRSDSVPGPGTLVADCVWGFDAFLVGARVISDLASLNALNSASVLYSSKPIISEAPEDSFAAPIKSQAPLRASSACVNAAMPLESGYDVDFSGHRRPGSGKTGSDIGADELSG